MQTRLAEIGLTGVPADRLLGHMSKDKKVRDPHHPDPAAPPRRSLRHERRAHRGVARFPRRGGGLALLRLAALLQSEIEIIYCRLLHLQQISS
jgi:hypothetical protein